MWQLRSKKRAESDQTTKVSTSAGSMQQALMDAGVVKKSQVQALRKENDSFFQRYAAETHPQVSQHIATQEAEFKKHFAEKRSPETLLEWRIWEVVGLVEKAFVSAQTHNFILHLVASYVPQSEAGKVRAPLQVQTKLSKDPITHCEITQTPPPIPSRLVDKLKRDFDSDEFKKGIKMFREWPEQVLCSPDSKTLIGAITLRALQRWTTVQSRFNNRVVAKVLTPR